ncbi:DUF2975 domain-containing protein [Thalassobellus citreus]|uniref:DUF2975 domain-containing protein n=1 Tax=Thalassobellus citreus TaxID=3367752 RepID=UPI0037982141
MKSISILKKLINIYYYLLVLILVAGALSFPLLFFKKKYEVKFIGYLIDLNSLNYVNVCIIFILIITLWGLYFLAIKRLRKSVQDLSTGHYFSQLVVTNFKKSGILFLISGAGEFIAKIILSVILKNEFKLSLDTSTILFVIMGLFLMFLSEVFQKARELKQENDLTI